MEKGREFYNEAYSRIASYKYKYEKSPYFDIWIKAAESILHDDYIIDIGCGSGQFASMCVDMDINYKIGVDFSSEAISIASSLKLSGVKFLCLDAFKYLKQLEKDTKTRKTHNTITCFEVLEHIENDVYLLGLINPGVKIIFSVPDFMSKSHLRVFKSESEITERYGHLIDIKKISKINVGEKNFIFVVTGYKK